MTKPISDHDILDALQRILNNQEIDPPDLALDLNLNEGQVSKESVPKVLFEEVSFNKPFDIPSELKGAVRGVLNQLNHQPGIKKIFDFLNVKPSTDSYYRDHLGLLLNIATAIGVQQECAYGSFFEILTYATYLHDWSLINKPHLIKISTKAELEQQKGQLQFREDRDVLEHPEWMASQLEKFQLVPADAITIIRQHHEMPDGTGFPHGINFKRLQPMSVLFIVAHDLTDNIIGKTEWDLKWYCQTAGHKFTGGQFLKTLSALSQCK